MTSEEHEDMKRLFGVVTEDLRSQIQQMAEGVTANGDALERFHNEFDTFRTQTTREFGAVRAETSAGFAAVRSEAKAFREETARSFGAVRNEAEAFREETARNFAAVHTEIASGRTGIALPRRPRTRRRPN